MEENLFRNKNWLIVQFNIVISLLETLLSVLNIKEYQIRITSEMKRFNFLRGHNKLVFQTRIRNFFVFNIREVSEFVFVWKTCFFRGTSIFCLESWLFFQVSVRNVFFVWRFFFFFFASVKSSFIFSGRQCSCWRRPGKCLIYYCLILKHQKKNVVRTILIFPVKRFG